MNTAWRIQSPNLACVEQPARQLRRVPVRAASPAAYAASATRRRPVVIALGRSRGGSRSRRAGLPPWWGVRVSARAFPASGAPMCTYKFDVASGAGVWLRCPASRLVAADHGYMHPIYNGCRSGIDFIPTASLSTGPSVSGRHASREFCTLEWSVAWKMLRLHFIR